MLREIILSVNNLTGGLEPLRECTALQAPYGKACGVEYSRRER